MYNQNKAFGFDEKETIEQFRMNRNRPVISYTVFP